MLRFPTTSQSCCLDLADHPELVVAQAQKQRSCQCCLLRSDSLSLLEYLIADRPRQSLLIQTQVSAFHRETGPNKRKILLVPRGNSQYVVTGPISSAVVVLVFLTSRLPYSRAGFASEKRSRSQ